jgi:hypothetical protein
MGGDDGFARRWLIHWITAMLFSAIFFFLLKAIERELCIIGADLILWV